MIAAMFTSYPRTLTAVAALLALLTLVYGGAMDAVYPSLLTVFEWLETTWFGVIGKTWGAAFAFVEAVHLLGLALLGGCVLAGDGRLLGVVLTDVPMQTVVERTHRVFVFGLSICLATGIFMACGVATKIYYLRFIGSKCWLSRRACCSTFRFAGLCWPRHSKFESCCGQNGCGGVDAGLVHGRCHRPMDWLQRLKQRMQSVQ